MSLKNKFLNYSIAILVIYDKELFQDSLAKPGKT